MIVMLILSEMAGISLSHKLPLVLEVFLAKALEKELNDLFDQGMNEARLVDRLNSLLLKLQ